MPKNKFQDVVFTIMMAMVMVYGMVVYNVALNTGGVTGETFFIALHELPIMVPIADMVGLPRQVAVLAYHFGDGFSNMIWPTSVATWCGMMKLPMDKWYKFVLPLGGILLVLEIVFIMIATAMNYGPF